MKLKKFAASVVAAAMAVSLTACGVNVTGVDVPENIELAVGETAKLDVSFLGDEGARAPHRINWIRLVPSWNWSGHPVMRKSSPLPTVS